MRGLHSDRTYTVRRSELIEKLKENRANHREIFEEAIDAFRDEAIKRLDKNLALAKQGKQIKLSVSLKQPKDHTKDYDRVISLLEMCVEETFEITEGQFQCYVMDEWDWSNQFYSVSNEVTGKAYGPQY